MKFSSIFPFPKLIPFPSAIFNKIKLSFNIGSFDSYEQLTSFLQLGHFIISFALISSLFFKIIFF